MHRKYLSRGPRAQPNTAFYDLNGRPDEEIFSLQATFSYSNDSLWGAGGPYNEHAGNNLKQRVIYCKMSNELFVRNI